MSNEEVLEITTHPAFLAAVRRAVAEQLDQLQAGRRNRNNAQPASDQVPIDEAGRRLKMAKQRVSELKSLHSLDGAHGHVSWSDLLGVLLKSQRKSTRQRAERALAQHPAAV